MGKKALAFIMVFLLLLTACSGQSAVSLKPEKTEREEISWTMQETILPDADGTLAEVLPVGGSANEILCQTAGETLYRVVNLYGEGRAYEGVCIQKLEPPYAEWKNMAVFNRYDLVEGEICWAMGAAVRQDGCVYILLEGAEGNAYLVKWTEESGDSISPFPKEVLGENGAVQCFYADNQYLYVVVNGRMQYWKEGTTQMSAWMDSGNVCQVAHSEGETEEAYLCGGTVDGKFRIWNLMTKAAVFSADDVFMDWSGKITFFSNTEGFLCTPEGVWQFSLKDGQIEDIFSFSEKGYEIEKVYGAAVREDGTLIMLAASEDACMLLERREDDGLQDKVELEFAIAYSTAPSFLQKAVADFNRQSRDCRIVLRLRGEEEAYEDYISRIQAEVSSGGGPALLADDVMDVRAAAEQGLLKNLTEELAEEKDEIVENARAGGEIEGEIYAVPYSMTVTTLYTSIDIVGERENWNTQEMVQYLHKTDVKGAVAGIGSRELFVCLALNSGLGGGLVDWEKGESRLNSEEAVALLELSGQYGDNGSIIDFGIRIGKGEVLADQINIYNFDVLRNVYGILKGKETYIGFPSGDDRPGGKLSGSYVAVNQSCTYPEGAIAFIRYLLSEEVQDRVGENAAAEIESIGFPVRKTSFDKMFAKAEELQNSSRHMYTPAACYDEEGGKYEYTVEPLNEEELKKLKQLLLDARVPETGAADIERIIWEEAGAYLHGDASAQAVCDIIQSRVQLYLDERK